MVEGMGGSPCPVHAELDPRSEHNLQRNSDHDQQARRLTCKLQDEIQQWFLMITPEKNALYKETGSIFWVVLNASVLGKNLLICRPKISVTNGALTVDWWQ